MRGRFGDPLFVRFGNRMAATPFTQNLAVPAARVRRIMETEISGLQSFNAANSTREFRIGMNELGAITLVTRLVRPLAQPAPNARLSPIRVGAENLSACTGCSRRLLASSWCARQRPLRPAPSGSIGTRVLQATRQRSFCVNWFTTWAGKPSPEPGRLSFRQKLFHSEQTHHRLSQPAVSRVGFKATTPVQRDREVA